MRRMSKDRPNILIVDDEPIMLEILNEYLTDMEFSVVQATNGLEAWLLLQNPKHQFDVVILDRIMPNMDGLDVLKKIKAHPKLNKIPVIIQTGAIEKHEIQEGLHEGCYSYLTKPYNESQFVTIVQAAVSDYFNHDSVSTESFTNNKAIVT